MLSFFGVPANVSSVSGNLQVFTSTFAAAPVVAPALA
jgi:hypothetical protein